MNELPSSILGRKFILERGFYRDQVSQELYSPSEVASLLERALSILNDHGVQPLDEK